MLLFVLALAAALTVASAQGRDFSAEHKACGKDTGKMMFSNTAGQKGRRFFCDLMLTFFFFFPFFFQLVFEEWKLISVRILIAALQRCWAKRAC